MNNHSIMGLCLVSTTLATNVNNQLYPVILFIKFAIGCFHAACPGRMVS